MRLILRNIGGNLILLLPLGFLIPILNKKYKKFKNIILLGLGVSIGIELIQSIEIFTGIVRARVVDIDDVILNVLGIIIGYWAYRLLLYLATKLKMSFLYNMLA